MKKSLSLGLALGLSLASGLSAQNRKYHLPPPNTNANTANPAKTIPRPEGAQFKAPAGFTVEEYASGFQKARVLMTLPGGTVLVSDSVAKGTIWALDASKQKKALLSNLDRPFGMAFHKGYLYVAEAESIKRYTLDPKTLAVGAGQEIVPLKGYGKGHWTRGLAIDPKTNKLYVSVGSGSNVDLGDPEDRNAVNIYNLDGSGHQIMAKGLRNPVGIHFNPVSGKLWTTVQERDGLGDELPPDFFTEVKQGAFYGWPYAYDGPNEEPRHKGKNPELVAKTVEPDVLLEPHASAMDFLFYTGKQFPAKYKNGAFLVSRGSSGRTPRVGYAILFLAFRNGAPEGKVEEFVSGFMLAPDKKEVWGRPVGITQMADGSLLFSEDGNNKLYRISFKK